MEGRRARGILTPDKRGRTGCLTCRGRRVKCDEAKPTCYKCRAGNFICQGYEEPRPRKRRSTASSANQASSPRPDADSLESVAPALPVRHSNSRQEQLPFYHHFVTSTAVRLFWTGHVGFWRDQVAQVSYDVDAVYEAILAIGAVHRAALLSSTNLEGNAQEVARCKVFGLSLYGRVLRSLSSSLVNEDDDPRLAIIVLLLCVYFECFMDNPKAAFDHLSAATNILQRSQSRLSDVDLSNIVPIYETILRLDTLANMLVPYTNSSLLYSSSLTSEEHPFWNRQLRQYWKRPPLDPSKVSEADAVTIERGRLIDLLTGHYNLCRLIWGCWQSERPTRDELVQFCNEMFLYKANSPAVFASCYESPESEQDVSKLAVPPTPLPFTSPAAALTVTMFNEYLSCALSMLAATDEDPFEREMEAFKLTFENLRICAGLMRFSSAFKTVDTWNPGISIILFHAARRCYDSAWQQWIITTLRSIGREGLCNGHAFANTLEIMWQLEDLFTEGSPYSSEDVGGTERQKSPLGPIHSRLIPVLTPREQEDKFKSYFLRCEASDDGNRNMYLVARASWESAENETIQKLDIHSYAPMRQIG